MTDELIRQVWELHDGGLSITQIARRLGRNPSVVHACIIEVWNMTNSERVAVGIKAMRGWEGE